MAEHAAGPGGPDRRRRRPRGAGPRASSGAAAAPSRAWVAAVRATAAARLRQAGPSRGRRRRASIDAEPPPRAPSPTGTPAATGPSATSTRSTRASRTCVGLRAERDAGRRAEPLRDVPRRPAAPPSPPSRPPTPRAAARVGRRLATGARAPSSSPGSSATRRRPRPSCRRSTAPPVWNARSTPSAGGSPTLDEACAAAVAAADSWPARLAEQERRVAEAQAAEARVPALSAAVDAAEAALTATRSADRLETGSAARAPRCRRDGRPGPTPASGGSTCARQRLDGMAAELAAQLSDGADCPVCGATEHPRPAVHTGPVVTADDEQAATRPPTPPEAAFRRGAADLDRQERELVALRAQAGPAPRRAGGGAGRPARGGAAEAARLAAALSPGPGAARAAARRAGGGRRAARRRPRGTGCRAAERDALAPAGPADRPTRRRRGDDADLRRGWRG